MEERKYILGIKTPLNEIDTIWVERSEEDKGIVLMYGRPITLGQAQSQLTALNANPQQKLFKLVECKFNGEEI